MPKRRCAVYTRISVSLEASVSLDRQLKAAQQYAAARGWQVVAVFRDDGVSASKNRPEDRVGWRALLDSPEKFDAVLVWKVDRLARRVLDFLHADEALQQRGAAIVAVEDPIDMTTAQGKAFATMLAVFGQMEADAISARVKSARNHLLRNGRVVGGRVPYGWKSVENPDGPGYVLAQHPEQIQHVRTMVERTLAGRSVYSTVQHLDAIGAPTPKGGEGWQYSTIERVLRHPIVAGMVPHNPDSISKSRGDEVLRGDNGLPVVYADLAVLPVAQWRAMVQALDDRASAQARPAALRSKTSGMLSGLVWCGEHAEPVRMWRGTIQGRHGYYCRDCHMAISNWEHVVVDEFLRQKGPQVRWTVIEEVHEGGAALLPEIEQRLDELDALIRDASTREDRRRLQEQQAALLDLRDEKREETPRVNYVSTPAQHFAADWAEVTTDEDRRAVLGDAMERIVVKRGRPGRRTDAQLLARLTFDWKMPEHLGTPEVPDNDTLAAWAALADA